MTRFVRAWFVQHVLECNDDRRAQKLRDAADWQLTSFVPGSPGYLGMQRNGYDCGIFMTRTADYLARGAILDFTQEDMPELRRLTAAAATESEGVPKYIAFAAYEMNVVEEAQ